MDEKQNQGILVVCEKQGKGIADASLELISEGRRLANARNTRLLALLAGSDIGDLEKIPGGYGADIVVLLDDPAYRYYNTERYATAVCTVVQEWMPEIVLFSATEVGRDLAPRCAARLHTGLCADCVRLDTDMGAYQVYLQDNATIDMEKANLDFSDTDLKMTRPAFGGHLMATIVCRRFRPVMATVRPGVMRKGDFSESGVASVQVVRKSIALEGIGDAVRVLDEEMGKAKNNDVTQARCIVAVGRGISKNVEKGLQLAHTLADALGGTVAGSRAAVDAGWVDKDKQIGQTGKTVRPDIYIAIGISGAIQHLTGMQEAGCILAINKDETAPILGVSDYALIGNLYEILPTLIKELHSRKNDVEISEE